MTDVVRRTKDWKFELESRLIRFAVTVLDILEQLPDDRSSNHVSAQLLRSGTSPAPNYAEALSAESRREFIHKLGLAVKELRETHVWLRIIHQKHLLADNRLIGPVQTECSELIAILVSSINTARKNLTRERG